MEKYRLLETCWELHLRDLQRNADLAKRRHIVADGTTIDQEAEIVIKQLNLNGPTVNKSLNRVIAYAMAIGALHEAGATKIMIEKIKKYENE